MAAVEQQVVSWRTTAVGLLVDSGGRTTVRLSTDSSGSWWTAAVGPLADSGDSTVFDLLAGSGGSWWTTTVRLWRLKVVYYYTTIFSGVW